ncbi:MAG: hypothetical protein KGN02_15415 [bacterium]|nr:hypothetical protein [bacterium]
MGRAAHAQRASLTARIELAVGACVLAIGLAGPPLEPLRMLAAAICCAAIVASARFVAALALIATILAGFLQHEQLRLTLLAAAALLGIAIYAIRGRERATTALAAACAVVGVAFLFLG